MGREIRKFIIKDDLGVGIICLAYGDLCQGFLISSGFL